MVGIADVHRSPVSRHWKLERVPFFTGKTAVRSGASRNAYSRHRPALDLADTTFRLVSLKFVFQVRIQ